jgi:hypothetical protein
MQGSWQKGYFATPGIDRLWPWTGQVRYDDGGGMDVTFPYRWLGAYRYAGDSMHAVVLGGLAYGVASRWTSRGGLGVTRSRWSARRYEPPIDGRLRPE